MHDQDQEPLTVAEEDDRTDKAIIDLLIDPAVQRPWAVEEIAREIGDTIETVDSLARLAGAGLIHRLDDFAWASRAALHSERLTF
jgi:hypothetical protein